MSVYGTRCEVLQNVWHATSGSTRLRHSENNRSRNGSNGKGKNRIISKKSRTAVAWFAYLDIILQLNLSRVRGKDTNTPLCNSASLASLLLLHKHVTKMWCIWQNTTVQTWSYLYQLHCINLVSIYVSYPLGFTNFKRVNISSTILSILPNRFQQVRNALSITEPTFNKIV